MVLFIGAVGKHTCERVKKVEKCLNVKDVIRRKLARVMLCFESSINRESNRKLRISEALLES